jgi:hypothetical protein
MLLLLSLSISMKKKEKIPMVVEFPLFSLVLLKMEQRE